MEEYILGKIEDGNYYDLALYANDIRCSLDFKRENEFSSIIEEITGVNCHMNSAGASYNVLIKFLIEKEKK